MRGRTQVLAEDGGRLREGEVQNGKEGTDINIYFKKQAHKGKEHGEKPTSMSLRDNLPGPVFGMLPPSGEWVRYI